MSEDMVYEPIRTNNDWRIKFFSLPEDYFSDE